ncbi:MAG: DUF6506 family protein [Deltaproteobacteria bacterium]|jgi:hypothetical protein|nr:DUF6506 family protein [Deltaproteobacteria bacterium]
MAKLKAAFMFVTPDADPGDHRVTISTPATVELIVVGVKNYQQAIQVSKELVEQEVQAIELCAGFGQIGVAKVAQAVGDKAVVGAVRFDRHPGLGFKSGDEIFDKK